MGLNSLRGFDFEIPLLRTIFYLLDCCEMGFAEKDLLSSDEWLDS